MKRCPQCEFIYEDDQSLCDMDGVLLVFDSQSLPNAHTLATVSAPLPGKTQRRGRMVPAFATLLLMLVIGSVYYVSTLSDATQPEYSPASATSTNVEAPAVVPSALAAEPSPSADPNQAQLPPLEQTDESQPTESGETQATPAAKPAAAPAAKATTKRNVKPASNKDDSKVGSILKKTGKILKKPFKL